MDIPTGLSLVCAICRWQPPGDLEMNLVESHFDMEPDHDPGNIKLELVALCCGLEMALDRSEIRTPGWWHHYTCGKCHRSRVVKQIMSEAQMADAEHHGFL
jgi:hypothetical protein